MDKYIKELENDLIKLKKSNRKDFFELLSDPIYLNKARTLKLLYENREMINVQKDKIKSNNQKIKSL